LDEPEIPQRPLKFIQECVLAGNVRWTYHVTMRLEKRAISAGILRNAVASFEVIEAYPNDKYLPSYLVRAEWQGDVIHAHIATDVEDHNVRVVTMYVPNPAEWNEDFRIRRRDR
jgi:hypothetical protein